MKVKKCCGFVDIRPGLGIWALLEIISAGLQFVYFKCVSCSTESLAVVGVDSVVGIVASSLLLYGVVCKRQKCAISFHLLSRTIYMATSIAAGILIFASVSKEEKTELSERIIVIVFGIYLCGKFIWGFYFWICAYSYYRTMDYYNMP